MKKDKTLARRVYVLITVMGLWGAAIGARLYFLHVVSSNDLKTRADRQQQRTLDVSPRRGNIYDRNGHELAVSIKVDSLFAVPDEIEDATSVARRLSSLTGIPRDDLIPKLSADRSFVWIKRRLKDSEAQAIKAADLPGIYFQQEDRRYYPKKQLAAHVLGYVNIDEEGMGGLEYRYNESVRGEAGRVLVMTDGRRKSYNSVELAPTPGADLMTTIDENIQYIVEKELQETVAKTRAAGVSIIAMDPRSGEILAMANHPTFNPNEHTKYSPRSWTNRAISHVYEPGSTFKVVTAAAAFEENLTTPEELIDCQMGSIVLYGHRIRDWHLFGVLSVKQIMQNSSDVGMIKLGIRLGNPRFADYISRFGFGKLTNIDLPGEERGLTKPASRWSKVSVGAISMGQEIGVTPLQILSVVSAVANGGILYRPFVVKADPTGERIMSTETTTTLRDMLEVVVTEGTAKSSKLDGYRAAGKTGTAQKIDETGRYSATKHVASFAGYAPASNPMFALVVVIDEPVGSYHGGDTAAPVFKRITEQVLRYMSVPPDIPLYAPQYKVEMPKQERSVAAVYDRRPSLVEVSSAVTDRRYSADEAEFTGVATPNFLGKSLRQVTEESLKVGLRLQSIGSGAAVEQMPPPGANVRAGSRVRVKFSTRHGRN